jgi:hypothetical protein
MQHPNKTPEIIETCICNMRFQCNISLLPGRMEARQRVEFTGAKLAGGVELAAPLEKTTSGPVEKAAVGRYGGEGEQERGGEEGGQEARWRRRVGGAADDGRGATVSFSVRDCSDRRRADRRAF